MGSDQASGLLRFEAFGSTLRLFVNNTLMTTVIDTALHTGSVGLRSNPGVEYDNFLAQRLELTVSQLPYLNNFPGVDQPLGSEWNTAGQLRIQNDQLQANGALNVAVLDDLAVRDVSVQANVFLPTFGTQSAGLLARSSGPGDNNTYLGSLGLFQGNYYAQIWRNLNGSWTLLASVVVTPSLLQVSGGQVSALLRFEAIGETLKLYVGNVLMTHTTDAALVVGSVGLRGGQGVTFDNLDVENATPTAVTLPYATDPFDGTDLQLDSRWTLQEGGLSIQQDQLQASALALNVATLNTNAKNVTSSMDVFLPTTGTQSAGLLARYSGPGDNNAYLGSLGLYQGNYYAQIWRNLNGVWSVLASQLLDPSVLSPAGTQVSALLRFDVKDSTLTLDVNGVQVTASDNTITEGGAVGIRTGANIQVDNYSADLLR
jgi:hypothetical protein